MATAKITRRTLDALVEGGVAGFLSDQDLKDFGLKASALRSSRLAFFKLCGSFRKFLCRQGAGGNGPALASPPDQARPAGQMR
jgi:hypothetical protein